MNRLVLLVIVGAVLNGLMGTAGAVILPPTDDTSGTLTYSGKPSVVTKRSLTSVNGTGTTLPVSRTRTAFVRFAVEETGMTAGTVEKARLTLYFPSVTKVGDLNLHVVTQDWDETFIGPTRQHPATAAPFLTIPAASVTKKQFVILDVTQQVRDWLTTPGTNFGFAVASPDGLAIATIGSKEGSASGYPPLLEIEGNGLSEGIAAAMAAPVGMVLIPAGAFTMGDSLDGVGDAIPVSTTVSAFYMAVNEVSNRQWSNVNVWAGSVGGYTDIGLNGSNGSLDSPVRYLTWYDCVKWCNARSEKEGRTPVYYTDDSQTTIYRTGNVNLTNAQVKWAANGYRLPTEAEWEKAARGGMNGLRFPWGNTISHKQASYVGDVSSFAYDLGPNGFNAAAGQQATLSGLFALNGYGVYDMAGNISEWCWDWYDTSLTGGTNPKGVSAGSSRLVRGGSWAGDALKCRCSNRDKSLPSLNRDDMGFRVVISAGQ